MSKLLLIDTSYLIFRSFFVYPNLTYGDQAVGALFGFCKGILTLNKEFTPDNIAFALDLPSPTWRHQIHEGYKAGRPEPDPDMISQIPIILNWARSITPNVFSSEGFEADDVINTLCLTKNSQNQDYTDTFEHFGEVNVFSSDKDLYQILNNPKIKIIKQNKYGKYSLFGSKEFQSTHDLNPLQWLDYKAMVGDNSDNLPGLKGVGPKTATKTLQEITHLKHLLIALGIDHQDFNSPLEPDENRLENFINNPKNQKLIQLIKDNIETLRSTYFLAGLQKIPGIVYSNQPIKWEESVPLFNKYGFKSLLKEVEKSWQDTLF